MDLIFSKILNMSDLEEIKDILVSDFDELLDIFYFKR